LRLSRCLKECWNVNDSIVPTFFCFLGKNTQKYTVLLSNSYKLHMTNYRVTVWLCSVSFAMQYPWWRVIAYHVTHRSTATTALNEWWSALFKYFRSKAKWMCDRDVGSVNGWWKETQGWRWRILGLVHFIELLSLPTELARAHTVNSEYFKNKSQQYSSRWIQLLRSQMQQHSFHWIQLAAQRFLSLDSACTSSQSLSLQSVSTARLPLGSALALPL